ncbi:MAG TPA: DUF4258 domain-containing protein [Chitinophagales bacterium]|nr:DUF4258 domain-containing protein [Chitinophagales bacterium]HRP38292.1 DUF4258 domain-containing protein [Chitinophagales bacterium]
MNNKKIASGAVAVIFVLLAFILNRSNEPSATANPKSNISGFSKEQKKINSNADGLSRNIAYIQYSKHARCRMDCRQITESEIEKVLETGTINYRKSELDVVECKQKYALEGYGDDRQHIRVIFAPCQNKTTVVTCIDLGEDWECACN